MLKAEFNNSTLFLFYDAQPGPSTKGALLQQSFLWCISEWLFKDRSISSVFYYVNKTIDRQFFLIRTRIGMSGVICQVKATLMITDSHQVSFGKMPTCGLQEEANDIFL
jgi:hypothetical protein